MGDIPGFVEGSSIGRWPGVENKLKSEVSIQTRVAVSLVA